MLDLEPIKERLDEATPGPWEFHVLPQSVGITVATIHSEHGPRETCWTVELPPEIGGMGTEKDAEFIAHAPDDIAALVAEVERLRGQVDELATLWEAATDAVNLDTDASLGEWQTAFDGLVAKYHESGYRAGSQDSPTENTAIRALIDAARALHKPLDALNTNSNRIGQVCLGCGQDNGNWNEYPCPTIRALGGEQG